VLIKATGGGGGMGIHKCFSDADVAQFLPLAVSQGKKNFGNGDVFVEKYIEHAKHIEVQARAACLCRVVSILFNQTASARSSSWLCSVLCGKLMCAQR
jgi:acetyl/propionyl-CoA carboxylase alpha subunit